MHAANNKKRGREPGRGNPERPHLLVPLPVGQDRLSGMQTNIDRTSSTISSMDIFFTYQGAETSNGGTTTNPGDFFLDPDVEGGGVVDEGGEVGMLTPKPGDILPGRDNQQDEE